MTAVLWPELDEVKQLFDVDGVDWDGEDLYLDGHLTRLSRLLAAAIARVKHDVGNWDEYVDTPDEALSQAALEMCIVLSPKATDAAIAQAKEKYEGLLLGHRRSWGIA